MWGQGDTPAGGGRVPKKVRRVLDKLTFEAFSDSFKQARAIGRQVLIYSGPPNSGKTFAAMQELVAAGSGAYLAPLRLLALEGRDSLAALGVKCDLLTGEDFEPATVDADGVAQRSAFVSATVEMVDTGAPVDVCVIDECQQLFDPCRGWAWTQAILGAPAKRLILIAAPHAVAAVERLVAACGELARVVGHTRKGKLKLLPAPVPLAQLAAGDCLVAFSRSDVLKLRDRVAAGEASGGAPLPTAVVYGALPAEVRRASAERFASGAAVVLVASDAVGMGLNLPIKRVLFASMRKYDGYGHRPLDVAEVHQIGGRAGRFGKKSGPGLVGVLEDACEPGAHAALDCALRARPEAPAYFRAPVAPNQWHVQTIARGTGLTSLKAILELFFAHMGPAATAAAAAAPGKGAYEDDAYDDDDGEGEGAAATGCSFVVVPQPRLLELAGQLDLAAAQLPVLDRYAYATAPVATRDAALVGTFLAWAQQHSTFGGVGLPALVDLLPHEMALPELEAEVRCAMVYLYLSGKFPDAYAVHVARVSAARDGFVAAINEILAGGRSSEPLAPPSARDGIDRRRGVETVELQPRQLGPGRRGFAAAGAAAGAGASESLPPVL